MSDADDAVQEAVSHLEDENPEAAVGSLITAIRDLQDELEDAKKSARFAKETAYELEDVVTNDEHTSYSASEDYVDEHGTIFDQLEELRNRDVDGDSAARHRDDILPAHKWLIDLNDNDCRDRGKTQERVARLFRRFVQRASGESDTGVDASGQTYSVTTSAATDILVDEGALDGVKKRSRSTVVARIMRETQEATLDVDCMCDDVDDCNHALVTFKPGKPHKLAVPKQRLEEYIAEYTERLEADDGGNSPEDSGADTENQQEEIAEESNRVFSEAEAVSE